LKVNFLKVIVEKGEANKLATPYLITPAAAAVN
jgi:hypothetical protein